MLIQLFDSCAEDLPKDCRDVEFLAGEGVSQRRSMMTDDEAQELLPQGDYMQTPPITYYSQRLAEGGLPATAARGLNPFGKSATFSNVIADSRIGHGEARYVI